jgi:hypothetical protein
MQERRSNSGYDALFLEPMQGSDRMLRLSVSLFRAVIPIATGFGNRSQSGDLLLAGCTNR